MISAPEDAALGFMSGIPNRSGKQGLICSDGCHAGGTVPLVSFEGPSTVETGTTATFTFVVRSNSADQIAAGFDVAASAGTIGNIGGQGSRISGGEIIHGAPKQNTDGIASWQFTWTAPLSAGSQTLFGAGNSVNLNGFNNGDNAAATTHVVEVVEAGPTLTPTDTPVPTDSPTSTPSLPPTDTPTLTPTTALPACSGDCNADREVTVDELVRGVNIALGVTAVDVCPSFDTSGDGEVTVDELVRGVNAALGGCPT